MKQVHFFIAASLTIFTACSSLQKDKSDATAVEDPTIGYVTLPSESLSKKSGTPLKNLHIGFGVYLRKCGECHTHSLPDDISKSDWHTVTPKMAWNANITDPEQAALLKYILAAKSDPKQPTE